MDSRRNREDVVMVTQASVGGFDSTTTAEELSKYLENTIGIVWRCRLKASWTPPDSYPKFLVGESHSRPMADFRKVEPHAFVHFASPDAVRRAAEASSNGTLFFKNKPLTVTLGPDNPYWINQKRRKTIPFRIQNIRIEAGFLMSEDEFIISWKGPSGTDLLVDPFNGVCQFLFTRETLFAFKGTLEHTSIKCNYRMEFLVREINWVIRHKNPSFFVVFLQLASSPLVSYRTADDDFHDSVPYDLFDDDDPWIRTTDFTPSGAIGRCNFYRLSVPPRYGSTLNKIIEYFRDRRTPITENRLPIRVTDESGFGLPTLQRFYCVQSVKGLQFETVFLVNALLHRGVVNQHQLSNVGFYEALRREAEAVNVAALKSMCSYRRPVFDVCGRLKLVQKWLLRNPKLLLGGRRTEDLVDVRRLVITPTKAYCLPPEVELSNRVLRKYREVSDRFLRVTFMDEGMQTLNNSVLNYYLAPILREISSDSSGQRTNVFGRIREILREGITVCGRKYLFLAFSSNQLRDRSAWFFSDGRNVTVTKIRTWMGKFTSRNVAKCAARMGLCFSSTYATVEVPVEEVVFDHPDIERNGYVFSDGIGMITPELGVEVAKKLRLQENPPCAYQIRYAGCKGVVACWPGKEAGVGAPMLLRPSMNKFRSEHPVLEVCSWTRFQPGFLNRQIVTLLSALEVPDEVFWGMQKTMVSKLQEILTSPDVAFDVLLTSCAEYGQTAAIMLCAGFSPETEPHLRGMLSSVRAGQFWGLREKSRIFVSAGRWLMGVLDESGVLEQGQCFVQVSNPSLESCFSKHGALFSEMVDKRDVVEGLVVIAKNPCLHPGDVRILQAVDAPDLHHLHDCLVFPQKGDRPHPNEASGSDLDGDLYFVTWDERLIPPSKQGYTPMDFHPGEPKELSRDVTQQDIIEFFTKNMVNESLGAICNAHVVHADSREKGALDPDCVKLAELAAKAVDFPKTGVTVTMPRNLKPKLYPDFMGKEEFQTYRSTKILGRLYRQIREVYSDEAEEEEAEAAAADGPEDIPYDMGMEVEGSSEFLADAWEKKCAYDGQLSALLGQYKVKREEEMVTGHIWSMPAYNSRKQGELKERAKHSYSSLRREFRQMFEEAGAEMEEEERNLKREQKASAWYQVAYHPRWVQRSVEMMGPYRDNQLVMLSFPWIAADYLVRVRIRFYGLPVDVSSSRPLASLARFIHDRVAL